MDFGDKQTLLDLEERCIQQQPPAAMATCPLHVDCRGLCEAVTHKEFDAARVIYSKAVPFPKLLSHLCRMPCQSACLRKDLGGAVDLRGVEWAAMQFGKPQPKRMLPMRKSGCAAVVGAGICGLTAALELTKKGCDVTVFEAGPEPGGGLLQADLPDGLLAAEVANLQAAGVVFRCNMAVSNPAALLAEFDAVLLATGEALPPTDEFTCATETPGIFAATGDSAVFSMERGKRAANTMDRHIKQVSLTAGREGEGPQTTRLLVNTSRIAPQPPAPGGCQTPEAAAAEAARCLNCQCLECVKSCAFIAHFKRYPRLYVREIYNNLSIAMGNHTANALINACALCGQCAAVCPNGLDLGAVAKAARAQMVQTSKMPPSAFSFAADDLRQANSANCFLFRHQPGFETSRYLFFPGCQLGASTPEIVKKTYAHLCANLHDGVGLGLGCCGIMAEWAGETALLEQTQAQLRGAWEALGRPTVIAACPSCRKALEPVFGAVADLYEILLETGLPDTCESLPVTIHDACGARDMAKTRDAVRALLAHMGCAVSEPVYTREQTPCCGYGGLVQFSNAAVAAEMTELCTRAVDQTRLTYCMNCRDRFTKAGTRAVHLLELLFGGREAHRVPTYSLRQNNREELKRTMLHELWAEDTPEPVRTALIYDESVAQMLDQRLILERELRTVIETAVQTGSYIVEAKSGLHIAQKRIGCVTYWAYFSPEGDGYRVHRAYSHRMEVR